MSKMEQTSSGLLTGWGLTSACQQAFRRTRFRPKEPLVLHVRQRDIREDHARGGGCRMVRLVGRRRSRQVQRNNKEMKPTGKHD
jgi:hypothetical protein